MKIYKTEVWFRILIDFVADKNQLHIWFFYQDKNVIEISGLICWQAETKNHSKCIEKENKRE
jgi:hypothetical protein